MSDEFKAEDESGQQFELGVSGLLFNSNLVMYDRRNDSLYPQLLFTSIFGSTLGDALELLPVIETTWRTLEAALSHHRGHCRYHRLEPQLYQLPLRRLPHRRRRYLCRAQSIPGF
jgi:hypothetical protein